MDITRYLIVIVDQSTGDVSVLHSTYHKAEAGELYRGAKLRRNRAGLVVKMLARPEPGWEVIAEIDIRGGG